MIMNFMVRPSKSFLFDLLEKNLSKLRGEIGLDAASASFKNRRMFKTDKYYGLDIDLNALKKAVQKYQTPDSFALYGNLLNLDLLSENSVDVVVSTNTLSIFNCHDRLKAVEKLSKLAYGTFFLELQIDNCLPEVLKILNNYFNKVKIVYYRNFFSRFYESIFEKDGFLGTHPIAGLKPFRLFAWLISRLEHLTCLAPWGNESAFIDCRRKKDAKLKGSFDLSNIPMINSRIYKLKQ